MAGSKKPRTISLQEAEKMLDTGVWRVTQGALRRMHELTSGSPLLYAVIADGLLRLGFRQRPDSRTTHVDLSPDALEFIVRGGDESPVVTIRGPIQVTVAGKKVVRQRAIVQLQRTSVRAPRPRFSVKYDKSRGRFLPALNY